MTAISHLCDRRAGWEQRVAITQLMQRLPAGDFKQNLLAPKSLIRSLATQESMAGVQPAPCGQYTPLAGPLLARRLDQHESNVVHAWSIACALTARSATRMPMVLALFDPAFTKTDLKQIRSLVDESSLAICCSSQTIKRRLIEGGVDPDVCVVIRPGVDFAQINQVKRTGLRSDLGLKKSDHVVIFPEPLTRKGNYTQAFLALSMLAHAKDPLPIRLLLTSHSTEASKLERLAEAASLPENLTCCGQGTPFESLLCVADTIITAPQSDSPTTALSWAMAAKVAIVASAVRATAELIANNLNGFLFNAAHSRQMAPTIARLVLQTTTDTKIRDTAQGQAYEVFSVQRYLEQHQRLYENLMARVEPSTGIEDPAYVS